VGKESSLAAFIGRYVVNNSAPNPFQPMIDAAASGVSKLVAALLLGAMVYVVVDFAFRLALRGRPSTKSYRQFSDLLARGAMGLSMLYFLYLGLVVIEPARAGVPSVVVGPFLMLALMIGAVLGCVILLLVFLGAGKTPQRAERQRKRASRAA
jgi:hypothetical protein